MLPFSNDEGHLSPLFLKVWRALRGQKCLYDKVCKGETLVKYSQVGEF